MLKCFTGGTGTNLILNHMFMLYNLFTRTDYWNFSQDFVKTQSHICLASCCRMLIYSYCLP